MAKKPNLRDVENILTAEATLNYNWDEIEKALENTLSRDGSTPNNLETDLDLNSNDLLNVNKITASDLLVSGTNITDTVKESQEAAATSATNAATSESNAATSETKAQAWAEEPEDTEVETGKYSALHHAAKAAGSAAEAALYDGPWVDDVGALKTDTDLTYTAGQPGTVAAGDYVCERARGFTYEVAVLGAADYHLATTGGVLLYVLQASDGAFHTEAFGVTGSGTETTAMQAALAAAENGTLYIDRPSTGEITTDALIPAADTTVIIQSGTNIKAISGGTRAFIIQEPNVHIWGYGAQTTLDGSQTSHNILIRQGAEFCSVRGLHIKGSGGSGDDCIYIGGDPANNDLPKFIQIIDCKGEGLGDSTRNCVSVVGCDGYLIESGEFWNALGSPGAGIDLEANRYCADGTNPVRNGVVRRNKIHSNKSGFVAVFYDGCVAEDNQAYNNVGDGIGSASGGTNFDDGVYRTGDRLGVISFDTVNGWIEVEDTNKLTDDLGIGVGTVLHKQTESGGAWPTEISASYYIVDEVSADQFNIKISPDFRYGTLTGFSGSGTGTLDKDPTVSDLHFHVFREGCNSNLSLLRNKVWGNGTGSGVTDIKLAQGVNYLLEDNEVKADAAGISVTYSQRVVATKNRVKASAVQAAAYRGMNIGSCSEVATDKNRTEGFGGEGLRSTGMATLGADTIINCGYIGNRSYRMQRAVGAVMSPIIHNDAAHQPNYGLFCDSDVTYSLISGARCKSAGTDNASSIYAPGTGMVVRDSIQYDGTFR